jgi:hypothetical protein
MEVCYVNSSFQLPIIAFYTVKEDRPVAVYIIAPQGLEGRAESIAAALKVAYKEAKVRVLYENENNRKAIERIKKLCLKAKKVVSLTAW